MSKSKAYGLLEKPGSIQDRGQKARFTGHPLKSSPFYMTTRGQANTADAPGGGISQSQTETLTLLGESDLINTTSQ